MSAPLRLSLATLEKLPTTIARPEYDPRAVQIGVVHFGPGAFHRVHQADFFDRVLATGDLRWGICTVSLHSTELRDALAPQDGLYTLAVLDAQISHRVIGSIRDCLVARDDAPRIRARLADPAVKLITLTVTEKGYCLDGRGELDLAHPDITHDLAHAHAAPRSVIGWLLQALADRHAAGITPPAVLSCDNLTANGHKLRAAVLKLAQHRDAVLADWIAATVVFPCGMVDSITPATDAALRAQVDSLLGLHDAWPVQREAFSQWVLEAPFGKPGEVPDLALVGVQLTSAVQPWEQAKLRLLNGAHSTLAWLGLLRGHSLVREAMADPQLAALIAELMEADIIPTLAAPAGLDLPAYAAAVRQRFHNPAISHQLAQIAWDSSQKLPFRLLGTVRDRLAAGADLSRLGQAIAGWLRFVEWRVRVSGEKLVDPLAPQLIALVGQLTGQARDDVQRWLQFAPVFGQQLPVEPAFVAAIEAGYTALP